MKHKGSELEKKKFFSSKIVCLVKKGQPRLVNSKMTGWENRALQVPPVVPYKALEKFPKALYGTTGATCSARFFPPSPYSFRAEHFFLC